MRDREPKSRKEKQLTILDKQLIVGRLMGVIENLYGKNRFGRSMLDYAKNGISEGGL
jgi:hypothetical protein